MLDITGRWVFITGASRGVGRQVVLGLAECGCNFILHSRSLEHTRELEEQLKAKGHQVYCVEADLADTEQIADMLQKIDGLGLTVDIVYNVAAVNSNVLDFFNTPLDYYKMIFSVNVIAIAQICQHFIPKMLENGFGRVVNMISTINNQPKALVYASSKEALKKMTKEMGYAVNGTDVMISMASPGWVRTDMGTDNAPNPVEDCRPGVLLGAVMDDTVSGRTFHAEHYHGLTLEEAYEKEMKESCSQKPDYLNGKISCFEKVCGIADFKEKYEEFLHTEKKRIVFGGGNQARFCLDVLSYLGCDVDGVMCTNYAGQSELRGIRMYLVDELPYDKDDCVVIVAITEQHMLGVEKMLKEKGYTVLPSYSVLYTEKAWLKDSGDPVSDIFQYKCNTFTGKGIGK